LELKQFVDIILVKIFHPLLIKKILLISKKKTLRDTQILNISVISSKSVIRAIETKRWPLADI
jgi:hypothetical protein